MKFLPLIALLALGACGVDGPPISPSTHEVPPAGVAVNGEARIGVVSAL